MWAVMTSKKAAKSILNPGGFATIEKMVNEITEIKDVSREDHNVTLPSTWSNVASRMLTGKALIGVAANANSAHAIFQLAPVLQTKISFNFNGKKEIDLNKQLSNNGKDITRNIAEYLAAFVDNGKNPLAKYININSYTIDVAMSMLLLGIDIPTVSYYLSQPALVDLADKYLSFGANNKAENKALRELSAKYKTNFFKNKQLDSTVNFNDKELKEGLTKSNDNFNVDLINSFLVYKRQAKAITNLVNASKVSESGAGATNADTLFKLNTIEQALNSELLVGQEFVLNNPNLFSTELNNVMRDTLTTIAKNTDMPDLTSGSFRLLNDFLLEFKSDTGVSAKDLDFMVKNFMDFLATKFMKFDTNLIKELPNRLSKLQNIDSTFLSRLGIEVDSKGRSFIMYNGVNGQDKIIIDRIREDWESLLLSEDANLRKLATDLIQYAFMMSGFRITPLSFSHLQPVKFYTDSEVGRNLNKYLRSIIKELEVNSDADLVANFIDQFTRNHFSNLNYVPAASYGIDDFPNVSSIEYINGKAKDRNAIPYTINIERDNYDFFVRGKPVPYIKYDHFGTSYLFKLDNDTIMYGSKGGVKSASYYPVTSLGINKKKGTIRSKFFTEYNIDSKILNSNFEENNKVNKAIEKYKEEFKFVEEEPEIITTSESENFQEIKAWFKSNILNLTSAQLDEMTKNNISNLNEIFDMPETPENIGLLHKIKCMS